jgi:hypothetical protein
MLELTPEQRAEILVFKISQVTKDQIVQKLKPELDKLASGHNHFDQRLADAIIEFIQNS